MVCGRSLLGGHVVVCVAVAMVARASFPVRWVRCVTLVDESLVKHNMLKRTTHFEPYMHIQGDSVARGPKLLSIKDCY